MTRFPIPLSLILFLLGHPSNAELLQAQRQLLPNQQPQEDHSPLKIPQSDPAGSDLIRFDNGDIMHGTFAGLNDGILWKRPDIDNPIRFLKTETIRQIIFNDYQTADLGENISYITLISGDRIPGVISSLEDDQLVLDSPIVGTLTIPRNRVRSIAPNPYEGELIYAGPFNSNGWMRLSSEEEEQTPSQKEEVEGKVQEQPTQNDQAVPSWLYSGAAFYSISRAPLVFDAHLPEVGRLRFKASYKSQINLAIAIHADLSRPLIEEADQKNNTDDKTEESKPATEEAEKPALRFESLTKTHQNKPIETIPWMRPGQSNYADFFGKSYVLNIYSSYPALNRSSFNEEGRAIHSRLAGVRNSVALPTSGETEIDIRFDRKKNLIMLFIDGKYSSQWSDPAGYLADGTGIGFLNSSSGNQIRISDLVITTWNGIEDSALSMEHPERDVMLLTNGTDRFSGNLEQIKDGAAHLQTAFAKVIVPLRDLSKIELNSKNQASLDDPIFHWKTEPASILFKPFGLIYCHPESSTSDLLKGSSPYLGELQINLKSATMLRLLDESPDISDWFEDL